MLWSPLYKFYYLRFPVQHIMEFRDKSFPLLIIGVLEIFCSVEAAAFNKVMHGSSAQKRGGFAAMMGKGADGQKAAVDEYFKHWDNKAAKDETEEIRQVSCHVDWT